MEESVKYLAYYRVSTEQQGLGLEAQRKAAEEYAKSHGGTIYKEYSEKESGKHENLANRKELMAAMDECQRTGATLLVAKLDRLARDVEFIFHLRNTGINFVVCDMPDLNTMTVGVMAVMAQAEREMCSKRTKEALAIKKAQGVKLGSHNGRSHTYNQEDRERAKAACRERAVSNPNNQMAWVCLEGRTEGKTLQELADFLNEKGIRTSSGKGVWTSVKVLRLQRLFQNEKMQKK